MKTFESKLGRDGVSFHVQGWEPDADPKAVVALAHGLGEHIGRYSRVGKALTDAGYALAGFDMRGHGKSTGRRGHAPSCDALMDDIGAFLAMLAGNFPGAPLFLYGQSLGGNQVSITPCAAVRSFEESLHRDRGCDFPSNPLLSK